MLIITTEIKYLILIGAIIVAALILARSVRFMMKKFFDASAVHMRVDPTNYRFLLNTVSLIIFVLASMVIIYVIPQFRDLGVTLFAGAGVISIVVGFASQQALSNVISGIFIVIFKPFRVGDVVEIGPNTGHVEDITLRHVVINNFKNMRVIIPNTVVSNETITNWNIIDSKSCNFVEMSISYDSNVDLAIKIMQEEAMAHKLYIDNRTRAEKKTQPAVIVRLISFGDSSVNLRAYVWSNDPVRGFELRTDLYKSIKARFDEAGIEIPYPYRTIVYKNPQP